jgi:anti-sigma B factor antagonist
MSATLPIRAGGLAVLVPAAQLDVAAVPRLRNELDRLVEGECTHVVVDLQNVSYLGEQAMAVLVGAWRRIRARGGELGVVCDSGQVFQRLDLAGLTQVVATYPSMTAALTDLRQAG